GEGEHFIGDRKAERFRSFEVDHQLELGWLHDWQVGWLLAFENATEVDADLTERVCHTGVVAHWTTNRSILALPVGRGNRMTCSERCDLLAPAKVGGLLGYQERADPQLRHAREDAVQFAFG